MAYKDYYQILGISKTATDKEIKKAYRKLATEYHPDKTQGNTEKEERFKEISEAYQILGNKEKRTQYDALGTDWEHFRQSGKSYEEFVKMRDQYQQQSYQHYGGGGGFGQGADYSDIFESFFGGRTAYERPGADLAGEVTINLNEAYTGTERILETGTSKIKLKIKPGAYNGLELKARGKGQKGSRGPAGDLYVKVRVTPHPDFKRKGDDLYSTVEVDVFDAILGGNLMVSTLTGEVKMKLKEGTQNGKTVRLKGKGMPVYGSTGRFGDLFVTLKVRLPEHLTAEQRRLIEQLKETMNLNV